MSFLEDVTSHENRIRKYLGKRPLKEELEPGATYITSSVNYASGTLSTYANIVEMLEMKEDEESKCCGAKVVHSFCMDCKEHA